MIIDSTARKYQVVLTAAKTTSDMSVIVNWEHISKMPNLTPQLDRTSTNGTTAVDILATTDLPKRLNSLTIYNKDTAAKTVQVLLSDAGTTFPIAVAMLQQDEILGYSEATQWYSQDASGSRKTIIAATLSNLGDTIHAATAKTTPVTADEFGIWDSVSLALRKSTFGEIASALGVVFYKLDTMSVVFIKTGANTISIKAGSSAVVAGVKHAWAVDTPVTMPTLTAGTDYAIYVCTDGSIRADASFTNPTGYTTANSRMIGGFHYGLVAAGTTVAGGGFATAGNGKIWVQGDVDDIAGINKYSIWDLKFRPAAADPRGMVLVGGRTWVDIYLCSTDTATNGTSKAGTNIASHTVLPKIPAAFGGNGVTTYPSLNWWVANELARANKKRLMWEHEFVEAAFGVTENQSIDATASTYPTTQRNAGYTSKYGIEQASGHHWTWGQDSSAYQDVTGAGSYKTVTGNTGAAGSERGSIYTFGTYGLVRVILGGTRTNGSNSGSRCSNFSNYPWYSSWSIGLRAACDHVISA